MGDTQPLQVAELNKMGREVDHISQEREGVGMAIVSSAAEGQGRARP